MLSKRETFSEVARAKVNLTLHVGPLMDDGYHPLHSLAAFADYGDGLTAETAAAFSLKSVGPFAANLPKPDDNLILKAARAMCLGNDVPVKLSFKLQKNLPVASGIGGGSADTAAALRMQAHANHVSWDEHAQSLIAFGADVPVCFLSRTCIMQGIGEDILPLPNLGRVAAVLVNPGVAVSTGDIFAKFDHVGISSDFSLPIGSLLDMAKAGRNDLQPIAIHKNPVIGKVLAALERQNGAQLVRMSGSGATCFALFGTMKNAKAAAKAIKAKQKKWWAVATWLGDMQT